MKDLLFKPVFQFTNFEGSLYEKRIPKLRAAMESEIMRCYNIYATACNSGITDDLNEEFESKFPGYFKENEGKDWTEMYTYNGFMAEGYTKRVCKPFLNDPGVSTIMDFKVDPREVNFTGYLKKDPRVTISFALKPVG